MCYSAMVKQNAKKMGLKYDARVQTDAYLDLFTRRAEGEKLITNLSMDEQFLKGADTAQERSIEKKIREYHEGKVKECEETLFSQKKRLADAERKLEDKETKKALEDQRIATKKIAFAKRNIEKHSRIKAVNESDFRVFPLQYMTMMFVDEKGKKAIRPFRYLMRPSNKDESFDRKFNGCYNARLDSLDRVPWWKNSLGKRHGIIIVEKFYESVATKDFVKNQKLPKEMRSDESLEICFEPGGLMIIPTLWDVWKGKGGADLYSAALITDDPAPEVKAAGHDRTPITLEESVIDDWLFTKEKNTVALDAILSKRQEFSYSHKVMGVA